jgi:hypothetical protein
MGIRIGVWLLVFGLVLVCVLAIDLCLHHRNRLPGATSSDGVADQDASTQTLASVRRTTYEELMPDVYQIGEVYEIGEAQWSMIEQMIQDRGTWMDNPE